MSRLNMRRSSFRRLARAATLILFVANVSLPRPGFFVHAHAGGEREHVHDDDGSLLDLFYPQHDHAGRIVDTGNAEMDQVLAEALGEGYHHHVHRHDGGPEIPGIEVPDPSVGAVHWHVQSPFQRAITAPALRISGLILLAGSPAFAPPAPVSQPAPSTRARGPPSA